MTGFEPSLGARLNPAIRLLRDTASRARLRELGYGQDVPIVLGKSSMTAGEALGLLPVRDMPPRVLILVFRGERVRAIGGVSAGMTAGERVSPRAELGMLADVLDAQQRLALGGPGFQLGGYRLELLPTE